MKHTFESAGNLLIKLAALDRPAMTKERQMIYDRSFFKSLLEQLIVTNPNAAESVEKLYHFSKTLSLKEPCNITSAPSQTAN